MNLEKDLLSILETNLKGYDSYVVGESILRYIVGKPIEEYLVITSAPLFSFPKSKKKSKNQIEIKKHTKKIVIQFEMTKEEYLLQCHFSFETLLFHIEKGIIDSMEAILDIQRKKIRAIRINFDCFKAIRVLYLKEYLGFEIEKDIHLKILKLPSLHKNIDQKCFFREFEKILLLDLGVNVLTEYQSFFQAYIPLSFPSLEVMRYTKTDFILRLIALLWNMEEKEVDQFFYEYGIDDKYYAPIHRVLLLKHFDLTAENSKKLFEGLRTDSSLWFCLKRAEALSFGQIEKIKFYDEVEKLQKLDKNREFHS